MPFNTNYCENTHMYSKSLGVSLREMPTKTHKPFPIELIVSLWTGYKNKNNQIISTHKQ